MNRATRSLERSGEAARTVRAARGVRRRVAGMTGGGSASLRGERMIRRNVRKENRRGGSRSEGAAALVPDSGSQFAVAKDAGCVCRAGQAGRAGGTDGRGRVDAGRATAAAPASRRLRLESGADGSGCDGVPGDGRVTCWRRGSLLAVKVRAVTVGAPVGEGGSGVVKRAGRVAAAATEELQRVGYEVQTRRLATPP